MNGAATGGPLMYQCNMSFDGSFSMPNVVAIDLHKTSLRCAMNSPCWHPTVNAIKGVQTKADKGR